MRCSNCGSENPSSRKFCGECGAQFLLRCPKCDKENVPPFRFCGECGAALADPVVARAEETKPITATAGERRHLTVLFCDLVGSTEIAAGLDPEEWRETVAAYHCAAAEAITRYGGHVAKYLGDGVMAYFGWPEAHENDAERAARAGLAILEGVSNFNQGHSHPKISVRVGIDSGAVVVGAGAGKDADVFGEAPNIAARVQTAADPDCVLITAATHRLLSGLFVVEDYGAQQLKGVASTVELYRVLRPTGVRSRIGVRGLTPFVGREEELQLLLSRWERAREGEGQLALVVGEAGIGKSRLVAEFHNRIRDTPHIWMESAGEQFFENTPFHVVSEMLLRWLELQGGASPEDRFERLERALASAGLKVDETAPLIADLLQLPLDERYPASTLTPEQKRHRLLAALMAWTFGAARLQTVVMVVEDLHWLDPSTLELQQLLAEQGAMAPLMLLYTARSEFRAQWPLRAHHTQVTLNRLSAHNVRKMIAQVAARNALTGETVDVVIERTGGVPLFVEELTRVVLESSGAKLTGREIPVTLRDSLMARLDRLGPAKEVIQTAAVIGNEFSYELLHAVHSIAEQDLQTALRSATDAELVYVRGIAPDATYQFKHALIRDAAYEALLKSRRKELHRLVAHIINKKFPALREMHPEVIARHWTEAGEAEQAISEWSRAAEAAEARNAFSEALETRQQALLLLQLLPESPERDLRELGLRDSVFRMSYVLRGHAAPETIDAIDRACALAEKTGNLARLVDFIIRKGYAAYFSVDLSTASALAEKALRLALRDGSPTLLASAYFLQFATSYMLGDLAEMEKHFIAGVRFFDDPDFRRYPSVVLGAFSVASFGAWAAGRADVARERDNQMMAAGNAKNAHELASALMYAANFRVMVGEREQAADLAARALALSEQHQLSYQLALSRCVLGEARVQLGRTAEGIALLRRGIAGLLEIRMPLRVGYYTALLAEAEEQHGATADALETIQRVFQSNPDAPLFRPEIFKIRGQLQLKQGDTKLAEADFREAIALARTMGAKAWELRATMSLARLLRDISRRGEALSMLADVYNWFTEGFDTADLKEAKALLDELSG